MNDNENAGDPATEPPAAVFDRARSRVREKIDSLDYVAAVDRDALKRVMEATFPAFCSAMQRERLKETHRHILRVAALLALNNIFWEFVCVNYAPSQWEAERSRFLNQFVETLKEGPGR